MRSSRSWGGRSSCVSRMMILWHPNPTRAIAPALSICWDQRRSCSMISSGWPKPRRRSSAPYCARFDRLPPAAAEIGQFVIHARRNGREHRARHQAVALEPAQRQGQHPLRDAADHALDLVEAARAASEQHDDEHAPFIADPGQDRSDAAAIAIEVRVGRQDRHSGVLGYHGCARVSKMCVLAEFADSHSYSLSYKLIPRVTIMKLLHIDSSVLGPHSVSRQVSAAIVNRLAEATPGLEVVYRDLTSTPLAHLSGSLLAAGQGAAPDAGLQQDLAAGQAVLDEFLAADIVVLGAPMYNFTIPTQLKAWIDRIVVAGKTFKYDAKGVEGMAGNKRVIIAIWRGGFHGTGPPAAVGEHLETYLRWVFGFIGVTKLEFISADGIQVGPEHREKALAGALQAATNLHASYGELRHGARP